MLLFWLIIFCLILFYCVSNKEKQILNSHKKQAIEIIKSFIYLCYSYPKKMDKKLIDNIGPKLINTIVNKKDFDTWIDIQAKKFGSIEIAIYYEINSILGIACILSNEQLTDIETKTLTRMEAISHKHLDQAFARIGKANPNKSIYVVRVPDVDD